MDESALRDLRTLQRQDLALALESGALEAMLAVVEHVRARAEAISAFFAGYPEHEDEARALVARAAAELASRRASLAEAEDAAALVDDDRERELSALAVTRAADHVEVAEHALDRARSALERIEGDATALPRELERLESEARRVAGPASGVRGPGSGPQELVAWASHARAELFVTLSQLAQRRERVIREANELATSLLGEPTYGSTVAQALRRVETR